VSRKVFLSNSEQETKKFASDLIKKFQNQLDKKCLIFALEGELGAGKTVFAKGVAEALGIKKVIRSPGFIIEREFPYRLGKISGKFFHIDLWRMESEKEIEKLDFKRYLQSGNIILIEWAEKLGSLQKKFISHPQVLLTKIKIKFQGKNKRGFIYN